MTDPIDPEHALLASIRQQISPTSADRARVGARVGARIAAGVLAPCLPDLSETPKPISTWQGLRGVGQQVAAASVLSALTFGAGYLLGRDAPREVTVVSVPSVPSAPPASLQPAPEPAPLPPAIPSGPPQARSVSSNRLQEPAPSASASSGASLSEEARELRRVDSALRAGMPLLALGILSELDQKVPRGVLTEERAAARLIARCQHGEAGARGAAALWLEKNARSVYATRVQASCTTLPGPVPSESSRDTERPQ